LSNGQQTENTLYESGIGWGIMLIVFAVLIWLFWSFFHVEVREMVRWIRYSEMWISSWFLSSDHIVYFRGTELDFHKEMDRVPDYKKEKMGYDHLAVFNSLAMQPLRIPLVILISFGALWCLFLGPRTQFRQRLDLQGFIERQSDNFPVIKPFVDFNPSSQPPRPPGSPVPAELPPFAEALGPEEWLAYNNIQVPDGKIDEESAARAFSRQLKGRWKGPNALPDYMQVMLASFCLKASRKRGEADDMLGRLAQCWSPKRGLTLSKDPKLLRESRAILKDKNLAGNTLSQANRHAFITTAMLRALAFAREEGGVMAPAQFVWLRAHDRTLWYPLNNMGRQSYHIESLGAMAHFKAERMTQRPIPVPKVESATATIQEYMTSGNARPIPQLDYSKSSKRGVKKAV